jgi:hypothetical protein
MYRSAPGAKRMACKIPIPNSKSQIITQFQFPNNPNNYILNFDDWNFVENNSKNLLVPVRGRGLR